MRRNGPLNRAMQHQYDREYRTTFQVKAWRVEYSYMTKRTYLQTFCQNEILYINSRIAFHNNACLGVWLSGRASALHQSLLTRISSMPAEGPGFDPLLLHFFFFFLSQFVDQTFLSILCYQAKPISYVTELFTNAQSSKIISLTWKAVFPGSIYVWPQRVFKAHAVG